MKKKIIIISLAVFLLLVSAGAYLNLVFLPAKIKLFIIESVQEATGKKVSLETLEFNIFKGLVLKGLVIYDDKEALLRLKEGSCSFVIPALFFKKIIIPSIKLRTLEVSLERSPEGSLNIAGLFSRIINKQAGQQSSKFNVFIYKIRVIDSKVAFKDNTLSPALSKSLDNLNLILRLSLPLGVKFDGSFEIEGAQKTKVMAAGNYKIAEKELEAKVTIKGLFLKEFSSYYKNPEVSLIGGSLDAFLNIKFKNDNLLVSLEAKSKDLHFFKDKIEARLDSSITAHFQYGLKDNQLKFSGNADVIDLDIVNLGLLEKVNDIKGRINFDNSGLSADKLVADVLGVPLEIKLKLTDFNNPFLNIDVLSDKLGLAYMKDILKSRFGFTLPIELQGEGKLFLKIESKIPFSDPLPIKGRFDVVNAVAALEKAKASFEDISGRIDFTADQLRWTKLNFRYLDTDYKTEGVLTDFKAPKASLKLSSDELTLESDLGITGKLIKLAKLNGRYRNSEFTVKGSLDADGPSSLRSNLAAEIILDIKDLKGPFKELREALDKIKAGGIIKAKVNLEGNIKDIKSCLVEADLSSDAVSVYGFKTGELTMNYRQESALADVTALHISFYEGTADAVARLDLASGNLPYWVSVSIKDVKLEKMKLDTPAKTKDISGILAGEAKVSGFYNDITKLNGAGRFLISKGKIWELNLFQGLGKLLFADNFSSIVLNEAGCDFLLQDKSCTTDNLIMKSEFVDLNGQARIGFDSSIDSSLNVHIDSENVPVSGSFKDIATAIIGQAGRFGVIKITGTLREPKYKFQVVAFDLLKALKNTFFGQ